MSPDFDDRTVLANAAAVLRSTVLPTIDDPAVRITVIQLIAVIERQLDPAHRESSDDLDEVLAADGGVLSAFRGRLSPP